MPGSAARQSKADPLMLRESAIILGREITVDEWGRL
jgi:hypothetical protein